MAGENDFDPAAGWLTERPVHRDRRTTRFGGAVGASLISHIAFVLVLVAVLATPQLSPLDTDVASASLSYVPVTANGGGGGGGNRPRVTVSAPVETTPAQPNVVRAPEPLPLSLIATSQPLDIPGAVTGLSAPIALAPPGPGGGGTQPGSGGGDGDGRGVGPGSDGNTGGGEYEAGDNVTIPELLYEKRPTYTPEATLARIQGVVEIEAVVMPDGSVARPRIMRSLDPGLNRKAVEAVTQWRFKPGRRRDTDQPVPVRVRIHLTFTLR
ncbi:MAG: energy transducer TonB [Vicinamibacterales bacterium]